MTSTPELTGKTENREQETIWHHLPVEGVIKIPADAIVIILYLKFLPFRLLKILIAHASRQNVLQQ
jgi:hypothetical protein